MAPSARKIDGRVRTRGKTQLVLLHLLLEGRESRLTLHFRMDSASEPPTHKITLSVLLQNFHLSHNNNPKKYVSLFTTQTMLDTISTNEFPLFGTMSSSSHGMEGIVIQRPIATESYSWSDLSMIVQDDSSTLSFSAPTQPQQPSSSCCSSPFVYDCCSSGPNAPLHYSESESTLSSTSVSSTDSKRRVRFASAPTIRTYSVVLGDHPLCDDGLAIELGWEYSDDEHYDANKNLVQQPRPCQKRSYLSRKQLLLDVAGCTKEELDQRSRELEARKALSERQRIHKEDYYYSLAINKR